MGDKKIETLEDVLAVVRSMDPDGEISVSVDNNIIVLDNEHISCYLIPAFRSDDRYIADFIDKNPGQYFFAGRPQDVEDAVRWLNSHKVRANWVRHEDFMSHGDIYNYIVEKYPEAFPIFTEEITNGSGIPLVLCFYGGACYVFVPPAIILSKRDRVALDGIWKELGGYRHRVVFVVAYSEASIDRVIEHKLDSSKGGST